MSYSGQSGVIAIGPQTGKGVVASTFYRFAATDIDFDAISPGGVLPPEIAGILTPRGAYKMGVFAAGGFSFIPRLDGDLGWLLLGQFGEVESVPAFLNAVMDWQGGVDSDVLSTYEDSDGWFTQPPSARRLAIMASDSDIDGGETITLTGVGARGEAVSETLAFDGLTVVESDEIYASLSSAQISGTFPATGKIAIGWLSNAAVEDAVMPYTAGDDTAQVITTGLADPPTPRVLVAYNGSFGDEPVGTVTVAGTDANGVSVSEDLVFDSDQEVAGVQTFATVSSVTLDSDFDSDTVVGLGYEVEEAYEHFFTYPASQEVIPWSTIRKVVPGDTYLYTQALDCKLGLMRFMIPQAGPIAARMDAVGRVPTFPEAPGWSYEAMDDPDQFAIANAPGYFKFSEGSVVNSLGVTGMIFECMNLLTTPQEEMVVGSNYPDDFGVRGRAATVRFVYRWKDPELSRAIMTGASSGATSWSPLPFLTDFEAAVTTPGVMGDDQEDSYRLRFIAPKVEFRQNGPIRLVGNQTIAIEFIGSMLTPTDSIDQGSPAYGGDGEYFAVALRNEESSYVWPS